MSSTRPRILMSWSSGKDSAWALHETLQAGLVEVVGLLTTVNQVHERVAMHAVRRELLQAQARALNLPLWEIPLPYPCSNAEYEELMSAAMHRALADGITHIAFGDLFLEDIRAYRVEKLDQVGMGALFPLWQRPTRALAEEMIAGGLVAHLTAVDPRQLDPSFVGRTFDRTLLDDLPPSVDPCGENGEFHTFVTRAPCFRRPIDVSVGQRVERDGFWFCDLLPLP